MNFDVLFSSGFVFILTIALATLTIAIVISAIHMVIKARQEMIQTKDIE